MVTNMRFQGLFVSDRPMDWLCISASVNYGLRYYESMWAVDGIAVLSSWRLRLAFPLHLRNYEERGIWFIGRP